MTTIFCSLLWFLVVPVIVGWIAGYLLGKKLPPAWFARFMQRRFARAFGVREQSAKQGSEPLVKAALALDEAHRKFVDMASETQQRAVERYANAAMGAARAVQEFSRVAPEPDAPLPSIGFEAPRHAVLSMAPRQITGTLRKSAGSMVHKIEDAPAPIRLLAGMLVEGTEYRLSKRDGAIHLMAMGEATPMSGIAQEARTAPQIPDKTDIEPDMSDDDNGSYVGAHAGFQRTLAELEVGQGHKLIALSDETSIIDVCERCNKQGDDLAEPCTPVNE